MKLYTRGKSLKISVAVLVIACVGAHFIRGYLLKGPDQNCNSNIYCLQNAYDKGCKNAFYTNTKKTVEGDPTYTSIKTERTGVSGCRLKISLDNSQDKYAGTGSKQEFTCKSFGGTLLSYPAQQVFNGCDPGHEGFRVMDMN